MNDGQKIAACLALLAEQSGEKVSKERLAFMASKLLEMETHAVAVALEKLLESSRRFPTIAEVKDAMGLRPPNDEDMAREIADKIWKAIGAMGAWAKPERLQADLGEVGWEVVRINGGWQEICNIATYDNATTLKSQWRGSAESILHKLRSGISLDKAPSFADVQLPEGPAKTAVLALTKKL